MADESESPVSMADEPTVSMTDEPNVNMADEPTVNITDEPLVNMADESPEETNEYQSTPYTGNVYAATPSSGSGGGDEDDEHEGNQYQEDQVDAHQKQQMESIYNYLQEAPTEDSTKKVNDWVNTTSTIENTGNPGSGFQQQCEKMEEDEAATADDETGNGENSQSMGDGTDVINKDNTPGENAETTFKIFVSNLPPGFLDSELKELFEKFGEVVECEIFAKSYAFVHMTSEESAAKAMAELNGLDLRGCKINVKRSVQSSHPVKPKKAKPEPETGLTVGTFKIFVGNLKPEVTQEYVKRLLEPYGRTVEVEIYRNTSAFVHMETEEGGKKAIEELNGKILPNSDSEKPVPDLESEKPTPDLESETPTPALESEKPTPALESEKPIQGFESETPIPGFESEKPIPGFESEKPIPGLESEKPIPDLDSEKPLPDLDSEKPIPDSDSKPLIVSESKNPEGPTLPTIKLKVTNLSPQVKADALRSLFTPYGLVLKVKVAVRKRSNPDACRSGIVYLEQFGNIRSAIKELSGKEIDGSAIHVEPLFDNPEPPKPKNKQAPFSSYRPHRPVYEEDPYGWGPSSYEEPVDWNPPNPNKMRLIPMPSQAELHKFPRSSKGRRLIVGPPPPPLMALAQEPFVLPPFQTQRFGNYNVDYESGYNEAINDGFGGGYSNYDGSQDYNPWNQDGNDYASPPQKMPRTKTWPRNGGGGGGNSGANGKAQFGRGKQNNTNYNTNNSNKRGLFPQLPAADQFPKAKKPSFAIQSQIPQADNTDWSSDYPISGFSQFSNNQDFTSDDLDDGGGGGDTHAIPFDYSQMQKRKYTGDRNARQQNTNSYQGNRGGGRGGSGGGGGSWGSKSGTGRGGQGGRSGKGKARRPGLGTSQQQKKAANQTGRDVCEDSSTTPGDWQPVSNSNNNYNAGAGGGVSEAPSSSSTYAPYYFQQNWSNNKGKPNKKATAKQIKEAEEEQKRQYAEYLKQKPWLYQAIPGTVKKVQQ